MYIMDNVSLYMSALYIPSLWRIYWSCIAVTWAVQKNCTNIPMHFDCGFQL